MFIALYAQVIHFKSNTASGGGKKQQPANIASPDYFVPGRRRSSYLFVFLEASFAF